MQVLDPTLLINYANVQVRLVGKLTETFKDARNTLAKFESKIISAKQLLCIKFQQNIGKIDTIFIISFREILLAFNVNIIGKIIIIKTN